jgi:hypothetical protein
VPNVSGGTVRTQSYAPDGALLPPVRGASSHAVDRPHGFVNYGTTCVAVCVVSARAISRCARCYANSVLQSLLRLRPFMRDLRAQPVRDLVLRYTVRALLLRHPFFGFEAVLSSQSANRGKPLLLDRVLCECAMCTRCTVVTVRLAALVARIQLCISNATRAARRRCCRCSTLCDSAIRHSRATRGSRYV